MNEFQARLLTELWDVYNSQAEKNTILEIIKDRV